MAVSAELEAHLKSGTTNVCRAWVVTRNDGLVLGFTDHDRDFDLNGVPLRADTGLSAQAIQQGTGLSVDNSEALGMLTDAAINEVDIHAGKFDGAEVLAYLVNWEMPAHRALLFRGHLGEITRSGGAFRAELRGLAEALYQGLFNLTDFRPVAACDGCDGLRSCDEVVPGLAPRVENRVICVERPVCEPCLAEILPNVFGWIQLW